MIDRLNEQIEPQSRSLYVTLLLDESGSMQSCKGAAIAGFNEYVGTLRKYPAETRFTLTLFNSEKMEVRYHDAAVSAITDLDVETYRPDKGTPLYDAIGCTLSSARQHTVSEARKLCVILTDGEENASREYTRSNVFALIKEFEKEGWAFLYLGADHDVWAAGESLGVMEQNRIAFKKEEVGSTFKTLSESTSSYRRRKHTDHSPFWEKKPSDPQGPSKGGRRGSGQ